MKRTFLLTLSFFVMLATTAVAAKRNIVLFVTDDQSPDAGCYGNEVLKTPNIDALAADGVKFNHAFCTTASCSASRSVILTGIHNHANAHYGHQHSYHHFSSYDSVKSLPVQLKAAGYRTARIGKYHVAPESVYKFDQALPGNGRNAYEMADNCKALFASDDERPFFLYICTSDPHRGGGTVGDGKYAPNAFGNRVEGYKGIETITYSPKDVKVHPFLPDTMAAREEIAQYYQSVSRIDQGFGRLIENLKAAGVYDDTLILYTSDHGIAFPGGKTTLYEGGMRVPFIVRNPYQSKRGHANNAMVSIVDITPTLLDFAGALPKKEKPKKGPPTIQGRSFLNVLTETDPKGWDEVHASHTFHEITMYYPMRVVRTRDYKLIWNIAHGLPYPFASDLWAASTWQQAYDRGPDTAYGKRTVEQYIHRPKFEFYNVADDPHEMKNLADDPKHADKLAEFKAKLKQFQTQTKDPWVLKWKYE